MDAGDIYSSNHHVMMGSTIGMFLVIIIEDLCRLLFRKLRLSLATNYSLANIVSRVVISLRVLMKLMTG